MLMLKFLYATIMAFILGILGSHSTSTLSVATMTNISSSSSSAFSVSVMPSSLMQGDPALVEINGTNMSEVRTIMFNGSPASLFEYDDKPSAFLGIDLHAATGTFEIEADLTDGRVATATLAVHQRLLETESLPVPEQLGGNSAANQAKVVSTLGQENASLASLKSTTTELWNGAFIFPVPDHTVTDPYGYSRDSGAYDIVHKGTDFRADVGTPVSASNSGIVTLARSFVDYGETIVIDHGLGLETYYMHLSKINVHVGEIVTQGEIIGLSGATGYASGPHLHLSVHINGIAIDPMKFLSLFSFK